MKTYNTVFEITQRGYEWWPLVYGFIFVLAGLFFLMIHRQISEKQKAAKIFALVFTAFSLMWMFAYFSKSWQPYQEAVRAYREGKCAIAEGTVEDFSTRAPSVSGDGDMESFKVNGVKFQYLERWVPVSPGFHTTQSQGGIIRNGLKVRIHHTDSIILKLEVDSTS